MEEQAEQLVDGPVPEPAPRTNAGRSRPGDPRINRAGRPRGRKAASASEDALDLAPCTDRLERLVLPRRILACCLSRPRAPWMINLPPDFEIVASAWTRAAMRSFSSSARRRFRGSRRVLRFPGSCRNGMA
jgi:hypothetical protein